MSRWIGRDALPVAIGTPLLPVLAPLAHRLVQSSPEVLILPLPLVTMKCRTCGGTIQSASVSVVLEGECVHVSAAYRPAPSAALGHNDAPAVCHSNVKRCHGCSACKNSAPRQDGVAR